MAFSKKTWVDRWVQYPGRKKETKVSGTTDTYDYERQEGTVFAEGDLRNAANMNDMEDRIETEFLFLTPTQKTITWGSGNEPTNYFCEKVGNRVTLNFKYPTTKVLTNPSTLGTVPVDCRPSADTGYLFGGNSFDKANVGTTDKSFQVLCQVLTDGSIVVANEGGATMYGVGVTIMWNV